MSYFDIWWGALTAWRQTLQRNEPHHILFLGYLEVQRYQSWQRQNGVSGASGFVFVVHFAHNF